jgi:hypothetical protein
MLFVFTEHNYLPSVRRPRGDPWRERSLMNQDFLDLLRALCAADARLLVKDLLDVDTLERYARRT